MNLPQEQMLGKQIYNAIQGDVLNKVIAMAKIPMDQNYWRNILEGHSFKVEERLMKRLYSVFYSVQETLEFKDKVDFYITADASVNAFSLSRATPEDPHIININSSLINLMSEDELRFVVGHEFGHLINHDTELLRLINFVFPEDSTQPLLMQYKIRLWNQLVELVADRYGFLAIPDLPICISAFFKMSSGLSLDKIDLDIAAYLDENNKHLDYFRNDKGLNLASHPINPIRIQALNLFSHLDCFVQGGITEQELHKQVADLTEVLLKLRSEKIDTYVANFIATAGLMISTVDNECSSEERDVIIQSLSSFSIFPNDYVEQIAKSHKVKEIFLEAVNKIMEERPSERENMLTYVISVMMSDRVFDEREIQFVFEIGTNVFGYSSIEVAQILAQIIQSNFVPSIKSLG